MNGLKRRFFHFSQNSTNNDYFCKSGQKFEKNAKKNLVLSKSYVKVCILSKDIQKIIFSTALILKTSQRCQINLSFQKTQTFWRQIV